MTTTTSTVTWALVLSFILGGLNEVVKVVPSGWAALISAIIAGLGIYLHAGQIKAGTVAKSNR